MDRLLGMAVFVKAVDLGSFAAAAAAFDMSPPMVGKHVRALEHRLGVRLLNRTTRRQSLTTAGRAYYDRCRQALAAVDAADAIAGEERTEPRGRLRVSMPVHFGRRCAAPILLDYAQRYPDLELDLAFTDRIADLEDEGFDFAIRTGRLADRTDLIAKRVARQPMLVCASPAYLAKHGTPEHLDDLANHTTIGMHRHDRTPPWLFPLDAGGMREVIPNGRLRLDDLAAIADAAEADAGLGWLPGWLVRDRIQNGALVRVLTSQPYCLYDVHAVWPATPYLPRKVRLAIDLLAQALPPLMTCEDWPTTSDLGPRLVDPTIARTVERTAGLRGTCLSDGPEVLGVYSDQSGRDVFVIEREGLCIIADERFIAFRDMEAVNIDPQAKWSIAARRVILTLSGHEHVELTIDGQREQFLDVYAIHAFLRRRAIQHRSTKLMPSARSVAL